MAALRTLGGPRHYREIAKQMDSDGFVLTGKDPAANMLSLIYKDPRIAKGPKEGFYGLAEPEEPAT
jgi:hypothetical protein